jgi:type IV pilus assembly protein PilM
MARSVVTFDAGSSLLKMAVFSLERNRIQLTDFDVSPLPIPAEASLEETNRILARQMKAVLASNKVKTKTILVSISGQSVFTRFVKLPAVEEAKVNQIIRYEAQQQVPFPLEDVEWDHHIIGKTPTGEIDIVLVAVKNDVIASFLQECKRAGLQLTVVDVAPLTVYNCLRHAEREFSDCTAVVDLGARAANVIISEGDDLWARTIPIGGDDITAGIAKELNISEADAENLKKTAWVPGTSAAEPQDVTDEQRRAAAVLGSFANRLLAEFSRSIGFYRSQPGHSAVKRILLSGGGSRARNFKEFLSDRFKVDVSWLSPLKKAAVAPGVPREQLNQASDLLAGVVGLGLRAAEMARIRINLLPKSIARQKELAKKKVLLTAAGWLLAASFVLMAFQKKIAHGDNTQAFNGLVTSIENTVGGIVPRGTTYKEELERLSSIARQDDTMASKIRAIKNQITAVEKNVDRISEIQAARLYWSQFIEDLKNTKIDVAGRGQRNYIWITSLRLSPTLATAVDYVPDSVDSAGSMYLRVYDETGYGVGRSARSGRSASDSRPWVIITGYVKIPAEFKGDKSEATKRAEALMKALQAMGQAFVCQKDHRYLEDRDTGYLIPASPDKGPARAYRYVWDDAKKEIILEGLVTVETADEEEAPAPAEEWKELARSKSRKKPEWIVDGPIPEGAIGVPCSIELARAESKGRARPITRTDGYLSDVEVRWLELRSDRLARFTIFARFADKFEYPKKSTML